MLVNEFPAQDLISNCNEAHYYSVVFHCMGYRGIESGPKWEPEGFPKYTGRFSDSFNESLKGLSEKFSDGLESFQMAWKVSRWSEKFPDGLETFYVYKNFPGLQKLSR